MGSRRSVFVGLVVAAALCAGPGVASFAARFAAAEAPQAAPVVELPNRSNSLKFAVLGDFGTGDRDQYQVAEQMAKLRTRFPFELVITVGDNIYGGERPQDMKRKFEDPYKPLLDAGVKFYASLGNHDDRAQARYKLFNMEGRTYYTFKAPKQDVRFFALETDYLTPPQVAWLEKELVNSGEDWKIPYFHHPLYSSGKTHGSHPDLAVVLEPLFLKAGVSVVFTGHDHFYERIKPQKGIVYFVTGSGGKLRRDDINRKTGLTAVGVDTDHAFLAAEIDGDELYFNTISKVGKIIDSGVIQRRKQE
jgi:predicted MPP superfamily phosphohydrolase